MLTEKDEISVTGHLIDEEHVLIVNASGHRNSVIEEGMAELLVAFRKKNYWLPEHVSLLIGII